jgi:hypothetical protein
MVDEDGEWASLVLELLLNGRMVPILIPVVRQHPSNNAKQC